jgi:hypothetical protein
MKPSYICVYGPSGMGKTSTVKSLPQERVLLLDAESGLASLHGTSIHSISLSKNDEGILIPEDMRFERLQEFMQFVQLPSTKAKYDYLFIDSLTEIAQNVHKKMTAKFPGFQGWGEYTKAMMDMLKFFRDIGHYTVIFTALEGRIEDQDNQSFTYPDIGGKKAKEYLLPQFDEVFRMVVIDGQRTFVTRTTAKTQAKDRSGKLDELEPANLMHVLNKMKGAQ